MDCNTQHPLPTRSIRAFRRCSSDISTPADKLGRTMSFRRTLRRQLSQSTALTRDESSLSLSSIHSEATVKPVLSFDISIVSEENAKRETKSRAFRRCASDISAPTDKITRALSFRRRPAPRRLSLSLVKRDESSLSLCSSVATETTVSTQASESSARSTKSAGSASSKVITEILPSILTTILVLLLTPFCRKSAPVQQILRFPRQKMGYWTRRDGQQRFGCFSRILAKRPTKVLERQVSRLLPNRRPGLLRRVAMQPAALGRRINEVVTSIKGLVNSETISVLAATSLFFSFLR